MDQPATSVFQPDPSVRAPLRLDTSGRFLGGPLVPPMPAGGVDRRWLLRCVAQLDRVSGH
jgi:hypothetical protein